MRESLRWTTSIALGVVLLFVATRSLSADDWPQWRGPNRDGVWRETGILKSIPPAGLKFKWRARVGNGYSGPSVAQGRVYVTDHTFNPELERVLCFEESTGKQLWVQSYPCDYAEMEYGNGPRASPTVHDGKVYTLGTRGYLLCVESADGKVVWQRDLIKEFNAKIPTYGASAHPLVAGDLLIVSAGGRPDATIIAFDRLTGEVRWKALNERPAYSPPMLITAGGVQQLIVWTADNISSLDAPTGEVHWQVPYKTTFDEAQVVASPVLFKDKLLCMAAWNRGSFMLKLDADKPGASVLWKTRSKPTTGFSTPIFLDDKYFYGVENDGSLCGFDAESGDELWSTRASTTSRRVGYAHLIPNEDRVFVFHHTGHLILARLTPNGPEELGSALLVEPTAGYRAAGRLSWAHPAFANKCVYARNDRELICASLAADQVETAQEPQQTIKPKPLADFVDYNAAQALAFSPDDQTLALGTWAGNVKLVDLKSGKELPSPMRLQDWVCAVAYSPDGKFLVTAGGSEFKPARNANKTTGEVKIWDVAAKAERAPLMGHTNKVFAAVFAPDSKTLVTGGADRQVTVWDAPNSKLTKALPGHTNAISSLAISADGSTLVSGSEDGTVRLWDMKTLSERGTIKCNQDEVMSVAISRDGRTIATGGADWTVRLWDAQSQKQLAVLNGHRGSVHCAAYSPDGRYLATGSGDETIRLWDATSGELRLTLRGHQSGVVAIAFSKDSHTLASAGISDAVKLWEIPAGK